MPLVRQLSHAMFGAALLVMCAPAQAEQQFENPEAAVEALVGAARGGEKDALLEILGPDGQDLISSGDDVADKNARESFMDAYNKIHKFEAEGDDYVFLLLGEDDRPFPIPVLKSESWKL